eukprot:CAMPEP_0184482488 /NCGR_PEP_ID=MMETSP0113_2-20130426/4049_1 /TAXON_ID=91329 /ORGANISM="Norrisiella sphaerica, Strain BC52" /LENGTH=182 /DNA_ID=CAMNT_0026862245 /DNA_START=37 /DNA_END=585 /DNA_ORIENTATION=-
MGNESSNPVHFYKVQVLKLSWRMTQAIEKKAREDSRENSRTSSQVDEETRKNLLAQQESLAPFHEDFGESFFNYCPELKHQFPKNYVLVAKMIQTFIAKAIEAEKKEVLSLSRGFAKSHAKYKLNDSHFEGFGEALVDTIQKRLGKFGSIELIKIWREEIGMISKVMNKEYKKARKKSLAKN